MAHFRELPEDQGGITCMIYKTGFFSPCGSISLTPYFSDSSKEVTEGNSPPKERVGNA